MKFNTALDFTLLLVLCARVMFAWTMGAESIGVSTLICVLLRKPDPLLMLVHVRHVSDIPFVKLHL